MDYLPKWLFGEDVPDLFPPMKQEFSTLEKLKFALRGGPKYISRVIQDGTIIKIVLPERVSFYDFDTHDIEMLLDLPIDFEYINIDFELGISVQPKILAVSVSLEILRTELPVGYIYNINRERREMVLVKNRNPRC
jgi:hypothetical protein